MKNDEDKYDHPKPREEEDDSFFGNFRQQKKAPEAEEKPDASKDESSGSAKPPQFFTNTKKGAMTMAKAQEVAMKTKAEEEKNKPKEKPVKKFDDKNFDDKKKSYKPRENNDNFDRSAPKKTSEFNYDSKNKSKAETKKDKAVIAAVKKEKIALEKAERDNVWGNDDVGNILS
jgi:hypothetical protein